MNVPEELARLIRYYILVSTSAAGSGHATSSLSAVELMTALYFGDVLRFDLNDVSSPSNDRVIFSKGHAAPLFYALYAAAGKLTEAELKTLRAFGSILEGHPTMRFPFTEAATGSLGQGLSIGVGMALNAQYLAEQPHHTYVLLGDSEMAEGQVWEAVQIAAYYKLNTLIGIIDVNRLGQRGETMNGHDIRSYAYKLRAFGWQTILVNGHDLNEVIEAYREAQQSVDKPVMIIAHTLKGKGVSLWENQLGWHSKTLNEEQLKQALSELGTVDKTLVGTIAPSERKVIQMPEKTASDTSSNIQFTEEKVATKKAFGLMLEKLGSSNTDLVVLDAEMSNSTHTDIFQQKFPHRFFEMFIAEQNMVSVAVGLARRGKLPVISTFAAFLTRAFDQFRMAHYSQTTMIVCGSYAGVSMGMDGSSQMGLEDIAMMRSIGSTVLYPSDAISMAKLLVAATKQPGITYLRATREPTSLVYKQNDHFTVGGSQVVRHSDADVVTIVAAGITLHEALVAHKKLLEEDIFVRVIDLYSVQPLDVRTLLIAASQTKAVITVEDHVAAGGIGEAVKSVLVNQSTPVYSLAVNKMPRSGKPAELLSYEEIDAEAIIKKVRELL